jgi:putative N-acetyltransferase (TIGR04045 family)
MNPITIKQADREEDFREVFSIRKEVFVEEQRMFQDSDIDENDNKSTYLIAKCNGIAVGTVRIFPKGDNAWVGGRLAVRKQFRGTHAGCLLVKQAVSWVTTKKCKKFSALIQEKNVEFFKQLGWNPIGEVISHLGLPHQVMEADLENGKGRE